MTNENWSHIFSGYDGDQGDLIPILQQVQETDGYISEESVERISNFLKMSQNEVFGVASFYSQFRFNEPGRNSIKICLGTACHVAGGNALSEAVQRDLGVAPGETTEDKRFDYERVACLGCCALAPVVKVGEDIHSRVNVNGLNEILEKYE
jgi:NADH:ubiquinone oxidoreductase subunit E